jgi:MerR family transcriptional regulator, copper efflux regulator
MTNRGGQTASLTIGRLAERAGVGVETIRFYERQGLIPEPRRTPSGYRQYPPGEASRLRFIRRAQELGFSLNEIRELLALRVDASSDCGRVRQRTEAKLESIDEKIRDLRRVKRALMELRDRCLEDVPTPECPILDAMGDEVADEHA